MSIKRLFLLLSFSPLAALAGSWSGSLVDSGCYEALRRNVNPTDTLTSVDRNTSEMIRYCAPRAKTKQFTIVDSVGTTWRLDQNGNTKAAGFVQSAGARGVYRVTIAGEPSGGEIKVESISSVDTAPVSPD
jgi:hypothetical protein